MSKFQLVSGDKVTDLVTIQGNLTVQPTLTSGGMCYLQVAWERATDKKDPETGRLIPTYISVKCWKQDAAQAVEFLRKGDKVVITATRMLDTYPDNRSDELKAKYPKDGYEYKFQSVKVIAKPKQNLDMIQSVQAEVEAAPKTKTRKKAI